MLNSHYISQIPIYGNHSHFFLRRAAAIALEDRQLRWSRLYLTHGMDRETIDSYSHYYVSLNPWALLRTPSVGEIRTGEQVLSDAELRDTEFYHGWFKPRGWLHASSVIFETSETERTYLFSTRPPNHPFTEKELAILKEIAPHLAKAAGMARRNIASHEIYQHRSGALEMDALTSLNLSRAESRIALALSHGQSVKEYAYSASLTADTVRWHVKRIYKKLGVHHRDDFKRLHGSIYVISSVNSMTSLTLGLAAPTLTGAFYTGNMGTNVTAVGAAYIDGYFVVHFCRNSRNYPWQIARTFPAISALAGNEGGHCTDDSDRPPHGSTNV